MQDFWLSQTGNLHSSEGSSQEEKPTRSRDDIDENQRLLPGEGLYINLPLYINYTLSGWSSKWVTKVRFFSFKSKYELELQ